MNLGVTAAAAAFKEAILVFTPAACSQFGLQTSSEEEPTFDLRRAAERVKLRGSCLLFTSRKLDKVRERRKAAKRTMFPFMFLLLLVQHVLLSSTRKYQTLVN